MCNPKSKWQAAAAVAVLLLALVAAAILARKKEAPSSAASAETRSMLGTAVTLTVAAGDEASCGEHLRAGFERVAALERSLSAWSPDSELTTVVREAATKPVRLSEDLFAALSLGVEWHRRTRGAFDITVSPLLKLWRTCGRENRLPGPEELAAARGRLGVNKIELNASARTVRFAKEGLRVDLGGLGKGYVADEVVKLLRQRGVNSALVAIAGDIYAMGRRPDGKPWRIGVQDPRRADAPTALLTTLDISDRAVSTSGNYQRFVEIQGRRYSHIVDPRTGLSAERVPSVTVIGPNTVTTDILGTALSVLGVKDGLALVEAMPGVEVMFVTFDLENRPHLVRSSGFSRYEATADRTGL